MRPSALEQLHNRLSTPKTFLHNRLLNRMRCVSLFRRRPTSGRPTYRVHAFQDRIEAEEFGHKKGGAPIYERHIAE